MRNLPTSLREFTLLCTRHPTFLPKDAVLQHKYKQGQKVVYSTSLYFLCVHSTQCISMSSLILVGCSTEEAHYCTFDASINWNSSGSQVPGSHSFGSYLSSLTCRQPHPCSQGIIPAKCDHVPRSSVDSETCLDQFHVFSGSSCRGSRGLLKRKQMEHVLKSWSTTLSTCIRHHQYNSYKV